MILKTHFVLIQSQLKYADWRGQIAVKQGKQIITERRQWDIAPRKTVIIKSNRFQATVLFVQKIQKAD